MYIFCLFWKNILNLPKINIETEKSTMKQLLNKLTVLTVVVFLSFLSACAEKSVESDKLRVIFETDIGNDIDDALALDMLYKMVDDIQRKAINEHFQAIITSIPKSRQLTDEK